MGFLFKDSVKEIKEEFLIFWTSNFEVDYTEPFYEKIINDISMDFLIINNNFRKLSEHKYKFELKQNVLTINDMIHINFSEDGEATKPYIYFDSQFISNSTHYKKNSVDPFDTNSVKISRVSSSNGINGLNLDESKNLLVICKDLKLSSLFEDYCYENMKNIYYNEKLQPIFKQNASVIRSLRDFFYKSSETEFNIKELFNNDTYYSLKEIINVFSSKTFLDLNEIHILKSDYSFKEDTEDFIRFVKRNILKSNNIDLNNY